MTKKNALTGKNNIPADDYIRKRREILDLCYKRLQEMIPECTSEVCSSVLKFWKNMRVEMMPEMKDKRCVP